MRAAWVILFAFAATTAVAAAQQPTRQVLDQGLASSQGLGAQRSTFVIPTATSCPVSVQAKHRSDGAVIDVHKGGGNAPALAQHLRVILGKRRGDKPVASIVVTVFGYSARTRMEQAAPEDHHDLSRTLSAGVASGEDGLYFADVVLPGFTGVSRIKLESIYYTDGSTWNFSDRGACVFVPDGMMPVSGN